MNMNSAQLTAFLDEKYIPLEPKAKMALAAVVIILPAILFYFLFFQSHNVQIQALTQQEIEASQAVATAKTKADDLEKFQKEVEAAQLSFDIKAALLPKDKEIPKLLKDISALGSNAGLDFISFKPLADVPKDFYSEIPVVIKVNGPYHNVGFFFDQISKLERIVSVSNITMGAPKKEGGEMLLSSDCQLVTYRFTNVELPKEKK